MSAKPSLLTAFAAGAVCSATLFTSSSQAQNVHFTCAVATDNLPTTFAQTAEGNVPVFKWKSTYFRPPYTPMQRCQEVTERMNNFYGRGMLDYLTSGRVNNQPVVCAGTSCDSRGGNVLVTLRPEQNPNQVLQELDANRAGAGGPSYQLTGGSVSSHSSHSSTSLLKRNADGSVTLNLNQYLDSATPEPTKNPTATETTAPGMVPSYSPPANSLPSRRW